MAALTECSCGGSLMYRLFSPTQCLSSMLCDRTFRCHFIGVGNGFSQLLTVYECFRQEPAQNTRRPEAAVAVV